MASTPPPACGELQFKLKAKDFFSVDGVQYHPGDIVSFPERLALGLVGAGAVDQLPPEQGPASSALDPAAIPPEKDSIHAEFTSHTGGLAAAPRSRRHEEGHKEGHK